MSTAAAAATTAARLVLPCENAAEWAAIEAVLRRPLSDLSGLDAVLTEFAASSTKQRCAFFAKLPAEASKFDVAGFWALGVPYLLAVALDMPALFAGVELPLLLQYEAKSVRLSRRQCACLLAHSLLGSITAAARPATRERWAFRAAQLFFLEATPSALCLLNYFKLLGQRAAAAGADGGDDSGSGQVLFERFGFPRRAPPWCWEGSPAPLCPLELLLAGCAIEDSPAPTHVDFANKFVGGGALEADYAMEEILFAAKPELIVAMALCSYMQSEEAIRVSGARQYSRTSGYGASFAFEGDHDEGCGRAGPPAAVVAMDALQGCARVQFGDGLVRRDLDKARVAFSGAAGAAVATGNWGCGAFGNDHELKFLQQWLAASGAGVSRLLYHTWGDHRAAGLPLLAAGLRGLDVGALWAAVSGAAAAAAACEPVPGPSGQVATFRGLMAARAQAELVRAAAQAVAAAETGAAAGGAET